MILRPFIIIISSVSVSTVVHKKESFYSLLLFKRITHYHLDLLLAGLPQNLCNSLIIVIQWQKFYFDFTLTKSTIRLLLYYTISAAGRNALYSYFDYICVFTYIYFIVYFCFHILNMQGFYYSSILSLKVFTILDCCTEWSTCGV